MVWLGTLCAVKSTGTGSTTSALSRANAGRSRSAKAFYQERMLRPSLGEVDAQAR